MTSTPQLEIPNEMRAVAEQRIEHAKSAFADFMRVAQGAVSALEDRFTASEADMNEIGDKAISFAGRNVSSAFDLAEKIFRLRTFRNWSRCKPSSFNHR